MEQKDSFFSTDIEIQPLNQDMSNKLTQTSCNKVVGNY
ncbi:hypothetical protein CLV93_10413 [Prolixibacter denitrificans]|uniref:Uncharacterized protein n=1 Tax=Prolixibacter denitrificans TaxID=1541063 RepID=A0A2P8CDM8_9BACT|nr:hypothetical protein CLV93_10413 [Prolixibacter denitrificans]